MSNNPLFPAEATRADGVPDTGDMTVAGPSRSAGNQPGDLGGARAPIANFTPPASISVDSLRSAANHGADTSTVSAASEPANLAGMEQLPETVTQAASAARNVAGFVENSGEVQA